MWWKRKKKSFFEYFELHAQEVRKASITLKQLFEGSIPKLEAYHKIKDYEHEADNITFQVIKQLCVANFIPPLDHQDILSFIKALDDVIDFIFHSVEAFVEIFELEAVTHFAKLFAEGILKGAGYLVALCPLIRQPAHNSTAIQSICSQMHELERQSDVTHKEALKELYRNYSGSKNDIAWDRIYESLEMAIDKVEDCANIAEQILMKYS